MEHWRQELSLCLFLINLCFAHLKTRFQYQKCHCPRCPNQSGIRDDSGDNKKEQEAKPARALQLLLKCMTDILNEPFVLHLHISEGGFMSFLPHQHYDRERKWEKQMGLVVREMPFCWVVNSYCGGTCYSGLHLYHFISWYNGMVIYLLFADSSLSQLATHLS